VLGATEFAITMTNGMMATDPIGAKSLIGS